MTATVYLTLIFSLLISSPGSGRNGSSAATLNKFVRYKGGIDKLTFKRGAKGFLTFTLNPDKGIHINSDPAPSFVFDSTCGIAADGKLEVPKDEKTKFVSKKLPIKQGFLIPAGVTTGTVSIRGTLTYYYCSDAEGWCSRFKQPVEISVKVTD